MMAERAKLMTPALRKIEAGISAVCVVAIIAFLAVGNGNLMNLTAAIFIISTSTCQLVAHYRYSTRIVSAALSWLGLALGVFLLFLSLDMLRQ